MRFVIDTVSTVLCETRACLDLLTQRNYSLERAQRKTSRQQALGTVVCHCSCVFRDGFFTSAAAAGTVQRMDCMPALPAAAKSQGQQPFLTKLYLRVPE
ncbi:hypothetical protein GUJ93_ZPchr0001g31234 [Zizania palustris]|uniref:Uncharacterized protein n=1 Tax=Zizania palustris TaxID=103762 RepID=A0A8J5RQT3_ZIZPA|nr:hypothetical protein GUJ93_ZPchr0001g31234 [Zizania palustris]